LERGAFEKSGVVYTSLFLQYMGLLLPMLAINTFVARLFMAGQKIMQSFTYQVAFNIVLIFFIWVGIQKTGITGYPLALITLHILNVLFCYILLKKFFPEVNYGKVLMLFLKIISLNFSILVLVLFVKDLLSSIPGIANLILGSMLYIMILLIVNWKIKLSPEINLLLKQLFAYTPLPRLNRKEP
jgi:peptidoglycan biosynthesis protein MviN/MurJ (putative lipid II flippase)